MHLLFTQTEERETEIEPVNGRTDAEVLAGLQAGRLELYGDRVIGEAGAIWGEVLRNLPTASDVKRTDWELCQGVS
jgi:hypothetical protein